jgi:hypothetical protein
LCVVFSYVKYPWIFGFTNGLIFYLENTTVTTPVRPKVSFFKSVERETSKIVIQPHKITYAEISCNLRTSFLLMVRYISISTKWTVLYYIIILTRQVKVKVVLCLTYQALHEDVWGSTCIDPRTADLGII